MVIQKQANSVESLLRDEIKQLVHRAPLQTAWHRVHGFAAPPVDTLDVKALAIRIQEAVGARLKAGRNVWLCLGFVRCLPTRWRPSPTPMPLIQ